MVRRSYLLQNTTKYDINLGDLRYKIPAGQTRDLLSRTAYLSYALIEKSKMSGSIAAKLKNGSLREVVKFVNVKPPRKIEAKEVSEIRGRTKSMVILDVMELDEQLKDMVLEEEEELLQELQTTDPTTGTPLVHRSGEDPSEKQE